MIWHGMIMSCKPRTSTPWIRCGLWNYLNTQFVCVFSKKTIWMLNLVHTKNNLCIQKKGDVTYFEDDFIYPELRLLKKYILPTESILVDCVCGPSSRLFGVVYWLVEWYVVPIL